MYFYAVETLESFGYQQYEISNFAKPGLECRHNLKYWMGDPYLGFGPAAALGLRRQALHRRGGPGPVYHRHSGAEDHSDLL